MDIVITALLTGIGLALVAGPLGCFIVWRRMSYFGDTLAHSALLGVTLGLLLQVNLTLAICASCVVISSGLVLLMKQSHLAADTLLGILAHSSLALGLIALSFMDHIRFDLNALLFGDILAVTPTDIYLTWAGGLGVLGLLYYLWPKLLMTTVHEALARVEGIPVGLIKFILMTLISFVIAIAMKIVGVLLITSMLIIPAATARKLANTPETMAIIASALGILAVTLGLSLSYYVDTPAGPSIVTSSFFLFLLIYVVKK
ncbi:zinc ABC transporter permease [Oleiphilus messinensis]|uniref:High-affinity zinc uptake system membrane protein ZnuB n=1 Tax=Oleiphilus messinensis TaxID=141451 RepID=A0A1Y0I4N6_9GAMM|nr:metal ABC transporter permease [Oleiphilus messinensis]ARU54414.1 zinc ABC transporter permease [Oleiphilus messinensis]